jgi:hypothetical protein
MPYRYAVLWEPGDAKARPVGLVVEQDGFVLVDVREELCITPRYDQPFVVRGPGMSVVEYEPGHPLYFDHVLMDLSRSFILRNEGSVSGATEGVVLSLLSQHVFEPLRREHPVIYSDTARTFPAVKQYQSKYYRSDDAPEERPEPDTSLVPRRTARLVAA